MTALHRPLVATAADRRVLVPLVAMLRSLRRYSPGVDVIVLSVGLSADDERTLRAVAQGPEITLRIIRVEAALFARAHLNSSHLTRTAYAPLFLPDILPDRDRVIWLDVDTIVLADLFALWRMDLRSALVAAVPDDFISLEELEATGTVPGAYFNSGVMVIDLARWRRDAIASTATALMQDRRLICEDQSVLNMACRGKVLLLDRRWNFHASRFHEYPAALRPRKPAIVHYCGQRKPWHERVAFQRLFMDFLPADMRTAVTEAMPKVTVLRRLELARRRWFGMLVGRPKHWRAFLQQVELTWADVGSTRSLRKRSLTLPRRAPGIDRLSARNDAGQVPPGTNLLEAGHHDADQAPHQTALPLRHDATFLNQ